MDPNRVKEIFLTAAEQSGEAARFAYLDRACDGDVALRHRVDKLLRSHDSADSFLGAPAVAVPDPFDAGTMALDSSNHGGPPPGLNRDDESDGLQFLTPSTRPDSLGRLGHYEILEVRGKGGFGIVFRAFDETLQRVVAIKMMIPSMAATSPARKRFLREARSSAKVRHENVVQVYAVEEQPLPYLVMEFIPGETLQQRLDRRGPVETAVVVQIGRQIAEGLAAAHSTGLIHRDIKPANILIEAGPNEHVKITDFGLARAVDDASMTQSGMVAGTPTYMAPEQARGDTLDHRADLFSLGSVLYTMCSGRPPFRANSTLAVLKRVTEDTPRPIPEIIPEVPPWLCEIITRLHAKKPEDRIATAREVADLLARGLEESQQPGYVPPMAMNKSPSPGVPEIAPEKRGPRFRAGLWTVAAVVLLLTVGGLGLTEASGVTDFRGTVVRLFSPEGTLVIEVDDPGVSIKIDDSELVITGAGAKEIRMRPGQYKVQAIKDGKLLQQELITVTKSGRQVVRISQESAALAQGSPDRRATEYAMSIGGTTIILEQGKERTLWAGNAVPETAFDLRVVSLIGNQLANDAGVDHFKGCKHLTNIDLENTNITAAKIWELKNALPQCKIIWDGDIKLLPGSADRRAAEYVLSIGGNIYIKGGGIHRPVYARSALPQGAFDLRNVNLSQSQKVTDADLAMFKDCQRNQSLALSGTKISDAGLAHLRDCKLIESLDLSGTRVTDLGLALLKDHLSLRGLVLNATSITNAGLVHFKYCKNLGYLGLSDTQVSDDGLALFKDFKNLVRLELARTKVSDLGLAHFKECKSFVHLDLNGTQVGDAGLAHFGDCKGLSHLDLGGTQVSDLGLAHFKHGEKLVFLGLNQTQISDAGLAHVKDCKNLIRLDLANSQVSDAGLAQLIGYPKLYAVNVRNTKVTEAGVKKLAADLPTCKIEWDDGVIEPTVNSDPDRRVAEWVRAFHLNNLHVFVDGKEIMVYGSPGLPKTPFQLRRLTIARSSNVLDETLTMFKGLRHLTHLNIRDCRVTDAALAVFKDCTQLQELQLHGTGVTDAGLARLAGFSQLKYLNLNQTAVTEEGVKNLAAALPNCKIEWDGG